MRYLEFLKLPAEKSKLHHLQIVGRSIAVDAHTSNLETTGNSYDNSELSLHHDSQSRKKIVFRVDLAPVRSLIGHSPVLFLAQFVWTAYAFTVDADGVYLRVFPFNPDHVPDITGTDSCTYRYRDKSELITWRGDAYSPVPGVEIPAYDAYTDRPQMHEAATEQAGNNVWNVTADVRRALLAGEQWYGIAIPEWTGTAEVRLKGITADYNWPYLRLYYLFGLEFFQADALGNIDLASMVDVGSEDNMYYLGALERGETGTALAGFVKNFSGRAFAHLEILDDHPEFADPVQAAGTGTGKLDYVELAEASVSQQYNVRFTSASAFEIQALAYRDNPNNLNPTYGGTGWTGSTASTFVAPSGGLSLPVGAWQPGTLVNDVFTVYAKGNSTVSTWPTDSGEQVQLANDDGSGNPDAATWRPAAGRRTKSADAVTIDATTKKIPTRATVPAKWIAGTKAFVADVSNINTGSVKAAAAAAIGTLTHTGTGLDDCAVTGNYNGAEWWSTLRVEIDATGTPDTFKWSKDGGSNWEATGVSCSSSPVLLEAGVYVAFGATTGHTVADRWDCGVNPWYVELENLTANSNVYAAGAKVGTSLPIRGLAAAVWGKSTAAAGASQTPANRVYLVGPEPDELDPASLGFAVSDEVYLQDVANAAVHETATIQTVTSTYIELDANLVNDYAASSPVIKLGSGEAKFHMRVIASATTTEELKRARLNVRI